MRRPDPDLRAAVFTRDGQRCRYCAVTSGEFHIDHVAPVVAGGDDDMSNLVVACVPCNLAKGAETWTPGPIDAPGWDEYPAWQQNAIRWARLMRWAADFGHVLSFKAMTAYKPSRPQRFFWSCSCGHRGRGTPMTTAQLRRQARPHLAAAIQGDTPRFPARGPE